MQFPSAAFRAALFPALILFAGGSVSAAAAWAVDAKPGVAASLAQELRGVSVNPNECFRVRNIRIVRDDLKIYLNDGFLIFSTPVSGTRIAAVFSGEIEGGDAEVLLMPPNRGERK